MAVVVVVFVVVVEEEEEMKLKWTYIGAPAVVHVPWLSVKQAITTEHKIKYGIIRYIEWKVETYYYTWVECKWVYKTATVTTPHLQPHPRNRPRLRPRLRPRHHLHQRAFAFASS